MFSCRFQHSAHTLVRWRNPSSRVLTTKPLASHLQGADTTQNCTFHRVGKRQRHTAEEKDAGKASGKRKLNSLNFISVTNSQLASASSVLDHVQHNLLDSHGSKSKSLHRFPAPDALTADHQVNDNSHCYCVPPLPCGPEAVCSVAPCAPHNLSR